jgi:hypothetical protein
MSDEHQRNKLCPYKGLREIAWINTNVDVNNARRGDCGSTFGLPFDLQNVVCAVIFISAKMQKHSKYDAITIAMHA